MFDSLRCLKEKQLAQDMVARLAKEIPAKFMQDMGKQLSVNKVTRSLEKNYQYAISRLDDQRLGMYRRSVLANTFKWGLKEQGYPANFVDIATEGLVVELAKLNQPKTGKAGSSE